MEYLVCSINGGIDYPNILGNIILEYLNGGILVTINIHNIPFTKKNNGEIIGSNAIQIKSNYNLKHPENQENGSNLIAFPVLIPDRFGYAYLSFYTDNCKLENIIGKVILIYDQPFDYLSNTINGKVIAYGVIEKVFL